MVPATHAIGPTSHRFEDSYIFDTINGKFSSSALIGVKL